MNSASKKAHYQIIDSGGVQREEINTLLHGSEPFDTIVSVSKVRYFWRKISYRYRISIEIPLLESISKVSVSKTPFLKVSVSYRYRFF